MTKEKDPNYKSLILFNILVLCFFAVLFTVGTFQDEAIAESLYSPDNLGIKILTSTGACPFFGFAVLFLGALCEEIISSGRKKSVRVILAAICYLIATFVGFIGAGTLVDRDSLGSIFPTLDRNIPVIAGICFITNPPLLILGYFFGKKSKDKALAKRIICILILLGLSFALMQVCKNLFHRPRYRLVAMGYENIGFIPWYTPFKNSKELIESIGIAKGEFRSFPSGHAILSMSLVFILQFFAYFNDKLKSKRLLLGIIALLFAVIILFTRMILGAHYLSDVCAGAIISTLISLIYTIIQGRFIQSE